MHNSKWCPAYMLVIFVAVLLVMTMGGCASTTLEELQHEAAQTGDWSQVQKREARIQLREAWAQAGAACKAVGKILYCRQFGSTTKLERDCECHDVRDIERAIQGF